jgi:hypothetical protein
MFCSARKTQRLRAIFKKGYIVKKAFLISTALVASFAITAPAIAAVAAKPVVKAVAKPVAKAAVKAVMAKPAAAVTAVAKSAAAAPAAAANPVMAAAAKPAYSTSETDIGTLADIPAIRAIIDKHLPGMTSNAQFEMARSMTFKQVQQFAPDQITDERLALIDADIAKLPAAK